MDDMQRAFARMWPERHDPPKLLPNGRNWTNTRASIRDNIRGQRAKRATRARDIAAGREAF